MILRALQITSNFFRETEHQLDQIATALMLAKRNHNGAKPSSGSDTDKPTIALVTLSYSKCPPQSNPIGSITQPGSLGRLCIRTLQGAWIHIMKAQAATLNSGDRDKLDPHLTPEGWRQAKALAKRIQCRHPPLNIEVRLLENMAGYMLQAGHAVLGGYVCMLARHCI